MAIPIKTVPIPGPVQDFTTATGPLPPSVKVMKVKDGIHVSVNMTLPSTMAIKLAQMLLDAALGELHK